MKIKCTPLFAIFVWRFRAEIWVWVKAWVEVWVEAPATISIGHDWSRCLSDVSRPQGRHVDSYESEEIWCEAAASVLQPWCESCSLTAWSLQSEWKAWSILASFCHYNCDVWVCCRCSLAVLWSGNLVSLKLTDEDSLCCIIKCSVVIAVALSCSLVVGVTMLVQEVVGGGVEVGGNLFDIKDSLVFCMLLTSQHSLLRKWQ